MVVLLLWGSQRQRRSFLTTTRDRIWGFQKGRKESARICKESTCRKSQGQISQEDPDGRTACGRRGRVFEKKKKNRPVKGTGGRQVTGAPHHAKESFCHEAEKKEKLERLANQEAG